MGTPKLPFVSVFPGKDTDTDVIESENLNRKHRQSRWLQAPPGSPFVTKTRASKTECCGSNNSGKATREKKVEPSKQQMPQRHKPIKWRNPYGNAQNLWATRRKTPAPSPPQRPPSRAAQQDSISRLSRAKVEISRVKVESVPRQLYYPQIRSFSINPRSQRAQAVRATSISIFI